MTPVYVNTCVYGVTKFHKIKEYIELFGESIGFEILAMFDLPEFEPLLKEYLPILRKQKISFHGPVFFAEHSAKKGTDTYEETMYHVRKTYEYVRLLHASHFVMHLNNCNVVPEKKEEMLFYALQNYRELREMFEPVGCSILVENTGTKVQGNMLLDQDEFISVCKREQFEVLVDIGHAYANGWDIPKVIRELSGQIRGYHLHNNDGMHDEHCRIHDGTMDIPSILDLILAETRGAELVIEYVRQEQEGEGLKEDIREVLKRINDHNA